MSANLPPSNSAEAAAAIHSVFIEREHPCSPMAAARCGWEAAHRYATAALAAQAAELEALRADAERYRIWRHEFTGDESDEATPLIIALNDAWTPEAVDAVLDAARAALKERAPND